MRGTGFRRNADSWRVAAQRAAAHVNASIRCGYQTYCNGFLDKRSRSSVARKAWDVAQDFTRKYVGNDVYGNYGPEHGWYSNFPKLDDRVLDSVRRSGGWKTYSARRTKISRSCKSGSLKSIKPGPR